MKSFLKYTLATITGIILSSILLFIIIVATLSAIVASGEKPASISDKTILVLKAGIPVPDRGNQNPFAGIDFINRSLSIYPGLNDILQNIDKAARDSKIKGILIENGLVSPGWATTEEIRNALGQFKESGKFIISYSDYVMMQEGYYLSTVSDKIYLSPGAMLDFKGLSGEVMFFKKALDKIGVEVQVTRHGKFKGAVEPFILEKLSKENKEQIKDYVSSIWNHVIENISKARGITPEKLNLVADNLKANTATGALENRLVDGLMYRDALIDTLKSLSGTDQKDDIQFVSMTKYSRVPDTKKIISVKNRLSVIYASGTIVMGKGTENNIGGNQYSEIIRKERLDTTVKAIVLRVNSPGGNAVASDIIWKELELAAKTKPVVISMGNYAASGGYFISAPGTKIYASPTTISGSIGVFGLIPNTKKLMEQKLGIFSETVNSNKYSDFPSVYRPMDAFEKEAMQLSIEQIYRDFVGKVAAGRKMSTDSVDSIGQGRVWTGSRCLKIGLVDEIGGLKDAITGAAKLAGLEKYSIRELPELEDPLTTIMNQLSGEVRMSILTKELGESVRFYKELLEIGNLSGIQARLPYFIEIH